MHYKLLNQNINDLFCRQTILAWKNRKAQDNSFCLNDVLIGILSYQLPEHGIYGKLYLLNLMNYFSCVLELRKTNQDILKALPSKN